MALAQPTTHVALANSYAALNACSGQGWPLELERGSIKAHSLPDSTGFYPQPPSDLDSGLVSYYWLDLASLVPPLLLGAQQGHAVLDMCAAPGGKSLALAQLLFQRRSADVGGGPDSGMPGPRSRLTCNEVDGPRRVRLQKVISDYLPPSVRSSVKVTPHDGTSFWARFEAGLYDRVLLDAPCSSDRHVVQQAVAGRRPILKTDWCVSVASSAPTRRVVPTGPRLLTGRFKSASALRICSFNCCWRPSGRPGSEAGMYRPPSSPA